MKPGAGHQARPVARAGIAHAATVLLPAVVVLLLGAVAAQGQVVLGVVADRGTYQPIDLATVLLVDAGLDTLDQSITDDGRWIRDDMLREGESLADVVYKDELLGVEVYEWPFGIPRQYTGKQSRGVILFWTKNEGTSP